MDLRERTTNSQRHPWERARLAFVTDLVAQHAPVGDIVDIGAGDAFVAAAFATAGRHVVAVDAHYSDDDLHRLRAPRLGPARDVPDGRVDLVLLLDVIEHVVDDTGLLRTARDLLTDTGVAIITVPAWPTLFSHHDRALLHHRRYTPAMLHTAIEQAGLRVVVDGGLFHALLVPRALSVFAERFFERDAAHVGVGGFSAPAVIGNAITAALRIEQRLSLAAARRGLAVPGLSLFAVVRR